MKVKRKSPEFEPVTLVLETQKDVDAMYGILGKTAEGDSGVKIYDTYNKLRAYVSNEEEPTIRVHTVEYGLALEGDE